MRAVAAWMLTAGLLLVVTAAGCNENQKQTEPVAVAPPQAPPPTFPESQVPAPEPQPAPPAGASVRAQSVEPPAPPEPVDETVTAPAPKRARAAAPSQTPKENYARAPKRSSQTYVVRKGDTLQEISTKFYGTTKNWRKIYEANRRAVKDPDKLTVGTRLVIP